MSDQAAMKCPNCGKIIKFPTSKVGATAKCPGCSKPMKLLNQVQPKPKPPTKLVKRSPPKTAEVMPDPSVDMVPTPTPDIMPAIVASPNVPATTSQPELRGTESSFIADGQDPAMVTKLLQRVKEICTRDEEPRYMAVQQKPVANVAPDAIVLTNRRTIIFRQKMLGRMDFVDVLWLHVADVHMKENLIGATVSIRGHNGHTEVVDYLPKAQARAIYRIGQEMEVEMFELRRKRRMEEERNAAGNVTVNAAVATPPTPAPASGGDLVSRLQKLQQLHEAGLITEDEFVAKKAEIMDSI